MKGKNIKLPSGMPKNLKPDEKYSCLLFGKKA